MNIEGLIKQEFGIEVTDLKKLVGYDNSNYLITTHTNKFVFKTYSYSKELWDVLEAENHVLQGLKDEEGKSLPFSIPNSDGAYLKKISIDGKNTICRMLSFIEGTFLGDVTSPNLELATTIGAFIAKLNVKLSGIQSYVLQAREWEWDLQHVHLNNKYIDFIENGHDRTLVSYFLQQYEMHVRPSLPKLRKQIIHNDINEWNILVDGENVSGLIDFGDLTHAPLINELAIAMTYIAYDKKEPLDWAAKLLKGYHKVSPILEEEVELLYYLVAARLCTSICNSAYGKHNNPNNSYTSVSEKHALSLLNKWIKLNPIYVEQSFRAEISLSTLPLDEVKKDLKKRHQHISSILSVSYDEPIQMKGSALQYMYDKQGNTFLDAYNNIPHVGHCHPSLVEIAQKQIGILNTNTRYLYDLLPQYAEKLISKFPKPLNKVFFVNSGSAASDLAIRMALQHTKKQHIAVMEHGYHGNTQQSIDVSDYKFNHTKGQGQKNHIIKTNIPDVYRGQYNGRKAGRLFAQDTIEAIKKTGNAVAAFIAEPIVGCGGQVPLADGYLKNLYPEIRKQGGVCISDEVQTGFGRLGNHFWGFEMHGVVPDIVVLGKPMGNGHPIGAVVTTDEIAASFEKGVEFFSSFGGNPVSCAIGLSVLEIIEKERLQENARVVGDYYKDQLKALQSRHAVIGDVRGSGLFIGIDIVHPNTKDTNHQLAKHIKNELRRRHILISTDGPDDSVLKTKPPLCFTKENVDTVVNAIDEVLSLL